MRLLQADGLADRHVDRRQPARPRLPSHPDSRIDEVIAGSAARPEARRHSVGCSERVESSRWQGTASTTRRRLRKRRSASRWAPAPMWRSRAPASRLVKGDLRGIVRARRLSRATMRNIRQNLFLAFVYNAVGVPVAAGVLYPLTGMLISPIWASAAMTFSSVSVIVNALRLRRVPL